MQNVAGLILMIPKQIVLFDVYLFVEQFDGRRLK
ncbi:MAG: hypothetical protein ACI85H_001173 [Paracoccaceae bacterium]